MHLEVLICPQQQFSFQNVTNVSLSINFNTQRHKDDGSSSNGCHCCPNCNWLQILLSIYESTLDRARYTPKLAILVVYCLFDAKFLFIGEYQFEQHAFLNLMQVKTASIQSHGLLKLMTADCLVKQVLGSSLSTQYINIWFIFLVAASFSDGNIRILAYLFSCTFDKLGVYTLFCTILLGHIHNNQQ